MVAFLVFGILYATVLLVKFLRIYWEGLTEDQEEGSVPSDVTFKPTEEKQ